MIFTSGMTPRDQGRLIAQGPVPARAKPEDWREAMELACANALMAARATLAEGETLTSALSLSVWIYAEQGFEAHSKFADIASAYLRQELGHAGIGARAALGAGSLPGSAPFEVQLILAV